MARVMRSLGFLHNMRRSRCLVAYVGLGVRGREDVVCVGGGEKRGERAPATSFQRSASINQSWTTSYGPFR